MTINLISKEDYNKILNIQEKFPFLTFENKGYEYRRGPENEDESKALEEVESILKESIIGFDRFSNFRIRDSKIQLRVQYNYDADKEEGYKSSFVGVGYLMLDQLLNGFK